MRYCFLIRDPNDDYGEKQAMKELRIRHKEYRSELTEVPNKTLVIGRYSVLPFYKELEIDVRNINNCELINTFQQFQYIADLQNWYQDLEEFTPYTWFSLQEYLQDDYESDVVLKGETNSKREKWNTHMYAKDKDDARQVYCRLLDDGLIGQQKIYIRIFEKFKKLIDGVNGMPIPNEWRVFVLYGQIISCSYYWSTYLEDIKEQGISPAPPPQEFIQKVINKIGNKSNFYSIDVAQFTDNVWMVVELNEGQQSGLNGLDPKEFYASLVKVLEKR